MKKIITFLTSVAAIVVLQSCNSTQAVSANDILTETNWELKSINGQHADLASFNNVLPLAYFSTDNKITGNGSCNRYSGSYNLNEEGGINISQVVSTKMACQGDGESQFMKALETVDAAVVDKDKLVLLKGVDEILVFIPKK